MCAYYHLYCRTANVDLAVRCGFLMLAENRVKAFAGTTVTETLLTFNHFPPVFVSGVVL